MDTSFLRNPTVLIMVLTTFLSSLSFFPVSIYITTYTVALSTPVSANFVLAAYNASSVFGQVGVGWISDRVSYSVIIFVIGMACSFTVSFAFVKLGLTMNRLLIIIQKIGIVILGVRGYSRESIWFRRPVWSFFWNLFSLERSFKRCCR